MRECLLANGYSGTVRVSINRNLSPGAAVAHQPRHTVRLLLRLDCWADYAAIRHDVLVKVVYVVIPTPEIGVFCQVRVFARLVRRSELVRKVVVRCDCGLTLGVRNLLPRNRQLRASHVRVWRHLFEGRDGAWGVHLIPHDVIYLCGIKILAKLLVILFEARSCR